MQKERIEPSKYGRLLLNSKTRLIMKIEVGKILKAQGIKGEVKMECYLDDPSLLKNVKRLYILSDSFSVAAIRGNGNFCYVRFEKITDRDMAEGLRGKSVFAEKEDIILPSGRYFIEDVIGMRVLLDNGETVGVVEEILQYGSADVYVCRNGDREVSFPFLEDLVLKTDLDSKTIELRAERFSEVAVYED